MKVLLLLSALLLTVASDGLAGAEPFVQADVYNALYDAQVQCGAELDMSRSEFITDMFERTPAQSITIEQISVLILHNIEMATKVIAEKEQERDRVVTQILGNSSESSGEESENGKSRSDRHKSVKQIDEVLEEKRRYVKLNECVVSLLK